MPHESSGLLVYGSLMHPAELALHLPGDAALVPVRVNGYRRSFCQEPAWRAGLDRERGVLTVRASQQDWFNGVLVCGPDDAALARLDHRERGYDRVGLATSQLTVYAPYTHGGLAPVARSAESARAAVEGVSDVAIYVGHADRYNHALLPNADYAELCTAAAEYWGDAFLSDFLATTFIAGSPLRSRLRRPRVS